MNESDTSRHFLRQWIEKDVADGKTGGKVVTRFPPEPNGYIHIGHAKAVCVDFGMAELFGGECHLRLDDTNPTKESDEYAANIKKDINWLGFKWSGEGDGKEGDGGANVPPRRTGAGRAPGEGGRRRFTGAGATAGGMVGVPFLRLLFLPMRAGIASGIRIRAPAAKGQRREARKGRARVAPAAPVPVPVLVSAGRGEKRKRRAGVHGVAQVGQLLPEKLGLLFRPTGSGEAFGARDGLSVRVGKSTGAGAARPFTRFFH